MAKTEKVSVPRLAGLTAPTDTEILSSEIMLDDQGDGLVLISPKGLCAFFDLGIVFLPALRSLNVEVLQGATGIIVPFFLSMLARDVKEQKDIQDLSEFFIVEDPEFPEWLQKTLKHRDHFIKDHMRELSEELERRVRERVDGILEGVVGRTIQEVMQPVLPHYAKIPRIVENQPWLFDRQVAAQS